MDENCRNIRNFFMRTEASNQTRLTESFAIRMRSIGAFVITFLLVLSAGLLLLVLKGKAGSFLWLNAYHSPELDRFFIYVTFLGDGLFAVTLALFCFVVLRKKKLGVVLLTSYLLSGLVAQLLKHLVVAPRPAGYFAPGQYRFFIQDITHSASNSFPSGHATTALALATVLALFIANRTVQLTLLLLGWVAAYSRVYLAQHFLVDILIGACIGLGVSLLATVYVQRKVEGHPWLRNGR
jgi:membrane-associated phospholipid phosphatase